MVLLPVNLFSDYAGIDRLKGANRSDAAVKLTSAITPYSPVRGQNIERRAGQDDRRRNDRRHGAQSTTLNTRDVHERRMQDRRQTPLHDHLHRSQLRPEPVSSSTVLRRTIGLDLYV